MLIHFKTVVIDECFFLHHGFPFTRIWVRRQNENSAEIESYTADGWTHRIRNRKFKTLRRETRVRHFIAYSKRVGELGQNSANRGERTDEFGVTIKTAKLICRGIRTTIDREQTKLASLWLIDGLYLMRWIMILNFMCLNMIDDRR